jgi:RNA polymerase sigma factor for flagellar operon FliA
MASSFDRYAHVADDSAAREALLVQHLRLVHHVARRYYRRNDGGLAYDELVSAGTLGLMSALASFDAGRRLAFSTHAIPRIRGAILDELRRFDGRSRTRRTRHRALARANRELTHTLARAPVASEQAAHLGVDTQTVLRWQSEGEAALHVTLDDHSFGGDTPGSMAEGAVIDPAAEIEHRLSLEQEVAYLRDALLRLGEPARAVLSMYYYEGLKLREIGAVLGISESRVSQIRSRALATIRAELGPLRQS